MLKQRKPDVLDAIMSGGDDDYEEPDGDEGGEIAVMSFEDDDEPEAAPEEGTPQAEIAGIRECLDRLEEMFAAE